MQHTSSSACDSVSMGCFHFHPYDNAMPAAQAYTVSANIVADAFDRLVDGFLSLRRNIETQPSIFPRSTAMTWNFRCPSGDDVGADDTHVVHAICALGTFGCFVRLSAICSELI